MVLERVEISFWQIVCCHTIAIFRNTYIKGNESVRRKSYVEDDCIIGGLSPRWKMELCYDLILF